MTTYSIYRIVNTATNECYVGQSSNPERRINSHFLLLRKGKHVNDLFQKAFDAYGRDRFKAEILETDLLKSRADEREAQWIKACDSFLRGYNNTPDGSNKPVRRGLKREAVIERKYMDQLDELHSDWLLSEGIIAAQKKIIARKDEQIRLLETTIFQLQHQLEVEIKDIRQQNQPSKSKPEIDGVNQYSFLDETG